MSFRPIARHETDEGEIIIGHEGHAGEYVAVLDALGGLEMTVNFTDVEFERHRLVFKDHPQRGRRPHEVASIECGSPESLGDVGEFLQIVRAARDNHETPPMEEPA